MKQISHSSLPRHVAADLVCEMLKPGVSSLSGTFFISQPEEDETVTFDDVPVRLEVHLPHGEILYSQDIWRGKTVIRLSEIPTDKKFLYRLAIFWVNSSVEMHSFAINVLMALGEAFYYLTSDHSVTHSYGDLSPNDRKIYDAISEDADYLPTVYADSYDESDVLLYQFLSEWRGMYGKDEIDTWRGFIRDKLGLHVTEDDCIYAFLASCDKLAQAFSDGIFTVMGIPDGVSEQTRAWFDQLNAKSIK